ncbi:Hypothetical predicted protein [Cloeon dipterum]|uniref:Uncharacterized protein n=1 Tax=Cloeon dipterum TaxID=197152 RepID=A0A8S1DZC2_9INSE|nr:Hypothetical predicted protein [Cloeon dipterum]
MVGIAISPKNHSSSSLPLKYFSSQPNNSIISHLDAKEDAMAGYIQNLYSILSGIALIVTLYKKYGYEYENSKNILETINHHDYGKPRMTLYVSSEKFSDPWINMGNGENEFPPDGTIYSEEVSLHNISLAFPLKIAGYEIRNVVLNSAGSIFSMDNFHQWSVIPMQGTYATSSTIKYFNDAGGHLTVQWEIAPFFEYAGHEDKKLLMQVQVFPDGYVMFIYKKIPFGSMRNFRKNLNYANEEGGFIFIDFLPDGREAIISIPISFEKDEVEEGAIIHFEPVPFCPNFRTCKSCSEAKITMKDTGETIPCVWCPEIKRCSSKKDHLQEYWLNNMCEHQEISDPLRCPKEEGSAEEEVEKTLVVEIPTYLFYPLFIGSLLYKLTSMWRNRSVN